MANPVMFKNVAILKRLRTLIKLRIIVFISSDFINQQQNIAADSFYLI